MNVSEKYDCGLWVPSYYGLKFRLARKGERFPLAHGGRQTTEIDPAYTFAIVAEAQALADERNTGRAT